MSHRNIRRIRRSCVSYHPGHQVHWIHAKKAHEPRPAITVVVAVHYDGHVELDGDDLHLSLWHHGPARLQSVLDRAGHLCLWRPRFHALLAPRYGGRIFNLAALDHLTPCVVDDDHSPAYSAETALERAARHARERGGYTVRLDSLCAPGSAANDDPAFSVASISYELPSSGCAVLDLLMTAVSSRGYAGGIGKSGHTTFR